MKRLLVTSILLTVSLTGLCGAQEWNDDQSLLYDVTVNPIGYASGELGMGPLEYNVPVVMDFTGGGARAAGMGNAYLGISDDVSALSWNPAGLYQKDNPFEQPVLGLDYNAYSPSGEHDFIPLSGVNQTYKTDDAFGGISMASILFPLRIKAHPFVFAIAHTRLDDEFFYAGLEYEEYVDYTPVDDDTSRNLFRVNYTGDYHSAVAATNIGFGTRLFERLSVGLAINIYGGKSTSARYATIVYDSIVNIYDNGQGVPFGTPLSSDRQRADKVLVTNFLDTTSYSGVYFTAGFRYKGDRFSAGLVIRPPHTFKQSSDRKWFTELTTNGDPALGGADTTYADNNIMEVDIPFVIGGGFAYNATDNWLLSVDAEYRGYSGGKIRVRDSILLVPGDVDQEFFTSSDPQFENVLALRFGTEYVIHTSNSMFHTIPVRLGFGYTPTPYPVVDGLNFDLPEDDPAFVNIAKASQTSFSAGMGVHWEQVRLDLAWVHNSLERDDDYVYVRSTSSSKADSFLLSFTGYF
ncbi:MAG: hypothetical protein DRP45_06160 [Candidatus Zixiibacteriota bacterium]|nr:MAG: hypothetical protein DRP45_06160 [candidate division Zixibacteria bacterium]